MDTFWHPNLKKARHIHFTWHQRKPCNRANNFDVFVISSACTASQTQAIPHQHAFEGWEKEQPRSERPSLRNNLRRVERGAERIAYAERVNHHTPVHSGTIACPEGWTIAGIAVPKKKLVVTAASVAESKR